MWSVNRRVHVTSYTSAAAPDAVYNARNVFRGALTLMRMEREASAERFSDARPLG
jgi:hypothetical protein